MIETINNIDYKFMTKRQHLKFNIVPQARGHYKVAATL